MGGLSGSLDVVGRTEGLQISIRRTGNSFSQEIAAASLRAPRAQGDGRDLHLVIDGREMNLAYTSAGVVQKPPGSLFLQATADTPDFVVETVFKLSAERGVADIGTTFTAKRDLRLSAVENRYRFEPGSGSFSERMRPDYAWLPHLKYQADRLAGQHALKTPVAFVQQGEEMLAIIPDLERYPMIAGLPFAMDLTSPDLLSCGLVAQVCTRDGFYRRAPEDGILLGAGASVTYHFILLLRKGVPEQMGAREVNRFLWARFPGKRMKGHEEGPGLMLRPQTLVFEDYIRYGLDGLFARQDAWRQWEMDGNTCGGTVAQLIRWNMPGHYPGEGEPGEDRLWVHLMTARPSKNRLRLLYGWLTRGVIDRIYFSTLANNLRTAVGLSYYGRHWDNGELTKASQAITRLILAAPSSNGLVPAVLAGRKQNGWINGTRGWQISEDFSAADIAETGVWLIRMHQMEHNLEAMERCHRISRQLLSLRRNSGDWSAVIDWEMGGRVWPDFPGCTAATVAIARFLAWYADETGDAHSLEAARQVADHVAEHVFPAHAWSGGEALPQPGQLTRKTDPFTAITPQDSLVIYWASDLMRLVYANTLDERYLRYGEACLNDLLLYQQIWDAPFLSLNTLGGFGATNTGPHWSEARQSLFAELLMNWYELTGDEQYFLRGILALRATFALMHIPENTVVAPGNTKSLSETDYGAVASHYGHAGADQPAGNRITPDWGFGTACTVSALVQSAYGDIYVDLPRRRAFGINGCQVEGTVFSEQHIGLILTALPPYDPPVCGRFTRDGDSMRLMLRVRTNGAEPGAYTLEINGRIRGRFSLTELERGVLLDSSDLAPCVKVNAREAEGVSAAIGSTIHPFAIGQDLEQAMQQEQPEFPRSGEGDNVDSNPGRESETPIREEPETQAPPVTTEPETAEPETAEPETAETTQTGVHDWTAEGEAPETEEPIMEGKASQGADAVVKEDASGAGGLPVAEEAPEAVELTLQEEASESCVAHQITGVARETKKVHGEEEPSGAK